MTAASVFISGAAAGIGKAVALAFANQGYFLGLADVNEHGLKALQTEIGEEKCRIYKLDVTDADAWKTHLADFVDTYGQLNVLVNNAGILDSGFYQDVALESHHRIVDINIKGVMNGCHAAYPYLAKSSPACVINMGSASAIYGQPDLASYAASKFAVRGLTEGLNIEWQDAGIRVLDIWPLFVQTDMVNGMKADSIDRLGVNLSPEDVAKKVLAAAQSNSQRVHWPVGFQANGFASLVKLMPNSLNRFIVKTIGR